MDKKELSGLVIVNKEEGITSQGVVNRVKRIFGAAKAGHTGTLDPMATGVLPVLIGRGVKASEFMLTSEKHYGATLLLGVTTDTEDVTGEVLTECEVNLTEAEVLAAISKFVGEIMQTPPMYSALKVGGKKLCDLAREGVVIERQPRPITVFEIEATPTESECDYRLRVKCSSGTYIRTLCADIGKKLGVGGTMATLCRTQAGDFRLENAYTLEALGEMSEEQRIAALMPTERLFDSLAAVKLPEFYCKLCRSGCEIYQKKIRTTYGVGERVKLRTPDGRFFALGEVRDFPDGTAIKAIKTFEIE